MNSKKKLIIYDLDGTLVDTREDIVSSVGFMMAEQGLALLPAQTIQEYVGRGMKLLIESCVGSTDPQLVDQSLRIYEGYYAEHMLDHAAIYEHVPTLLEYFSACTQVVITNKPDPFSTDMLNALELAKYFEAIVAGDAEYPKKPDPASTRALMRRFAVAPAETLFIGDSRVDVQTAKAAGVESVCLTQGFGLETDIKAVQPDWVCSDFAEVLQVARRCGW